MTMVRESMTFLASWLLEVIRSSASSTLAWRSSTVTRTSARTSRSSTKLMPLCRVTTSSTVRRLASRKSSEIGRDSVSTPLSAWTWAARCSLSNRRCRSSRPPWRGLSFSACSSVRSARSGCLASTHFCATARSAAPLRSSSMSDSSAWTRAFDGSSSSAWRSVAVASSYWPAARWERACEISRICASARACSSEVRRDVLSG